MATCQGSTEVNCSIQAVAQGNSNLNEEEVKEVQEAILRLSQRDEPVNILVIGPTGAGKSTLINALLGNAVAKVGHGAGSVTSEVKVYEGKYGDIKLMVYDTPGFSDTEGRSNVTIVREIAEKKKFDLILICMRMDGRADRGVRDMFTSLGGMMNKEMWKRTIIVLTHTNIFLLNREIKRSPDIEKAKKIYGKIDDFKGYVHGYLSKISTTKEAIDEIPFCLAGDEDERKLPTTDDWLKELWDQCLIRCSDEARAFLSLIAKYRLLIEAGALSGGTAVGAVLGAAVGAAVGSIVPIAGTITGGFVGAGVGSGLAAIITGIVVAVKRNKK